VVFLSVPLSSEITVPPVKIAISSNIAFLLSPKPGAFTAIFKAPRNLFTTNVDNASPSTSSAIIIMVFQIELLVQELVIILLRKKLFVI
jgi:hypothetical protein